VRIFLSHASEQADVAETVGVALQAEEHTVFRDRSTLPSGEGYNDRIREAIADSDLFIFLVSPEAVARGRYTITELEFAERRWPNPDGHVLPVIVKPTELAAIPAYLRAVTVLEPRGNLPASVAAAVAAIRPSLWPRIRTWVALGVVIAILGGIGMWWTLKRRAVNGEIASLVTSAEQQHASKRYQAAWDLYARAANVSSNRPDVVLALEQVAMDWVEHAHAVEGKSTFGEVVDAVEPVLTRCAGSSDATRSADCLAHLGWGDFLRWREGTSAAKPAEQYKRALARDPSNAYAHALLGFDILRTSGPLADAKPHFAAAVQTGRNREYVRHIQVAALLYLHDEELEPELIRVANEMRVNQEPIPGDEGDSDAPRFWNVYQQRLITGSGTAEFLKAVQPADHLATFLWLFPESGIRADRRTQYVYMRAALQENAGDREQALITYRQLRDQFAKDGSLKMGGSLIERVLVGIKRLSKAPF
jgi:tetratricopeptide (TPR) repeat protein